MNTTYRHAHGPNFYSELHDIGVVGVEVTLDDHRRLADSDYVFIIVLYPILCGKEYVGTDNLIYQSKNLFLLN